MASYCGICLYPAPCGRGDHDEYPSSRIRMPDLPFASLACYSKDHEACDAPLLCSCDCHPDDFVESPPITVPPSNR
jgi:hypothetical protein